MYSDVGDVNLRDIYGHFLLICDAEGLSLHIMPIILYMMGFMLKNYSGDDLSWGFMLGMTLGIVLRIMLVCYAGAHLVACNGIKTNLQQTKP